MGQRPPITVQSAVRRGTDVTLVDVSATKASRFTVTPSSGEVVSRIEAAFVAANLRVPRAEVRIHGVTTLEAADGPLELAIALAALAADGHTIAPGAVAGVAAIGSLGADATVGRSFLLGPLLEVIAAEMVVVPDGHLAISGRPSRSVVRVGSLSQAVEAVRNRPATIRLPARATDKPSRGAFEPPSPREVDTHDAPTSPRADRPRRGAVLLARRLARLALHVLIPRRRPAEGG